MDARISKTQIFQKTIEYGQEMPQSQLTHQPWAPQGRDTEHRQIHDSKNWEQYSHTISFGDTQTTY